MKKAYKATIVTPFHNTDLSIFRTTVDSVLCQTIGFENIEWIVVLHNCAQEYLDGVKAMLGSYDNVVLKELNNTARSASSPRNYGLQFVTSPYIEFLDSDDTIKPNTVETCLKVMEKHHPDMVVFRMAYVRQNDSVVSVITDITLWNPLEEEIVLTGENTTARPELYSTINFCTHNRFFDAAFLREHGFRFDEDITMAEDAYFTLSCYTAASKIVVLPQFVGHSYFVNSSSAVQSMQKTPEQVLHFSYGFKKMFDLLLEHNAYFNHFFLTILAAYIHYALSSPGFSAENWKTLQSDMRPYAMLVTPPPVNKFYTKEGGRLLYDFVTRYILKPVDVETHTKAYQNGAAMLIETLRRNAETSFGMYYGFEKILSVEDFREKIPMQSYMDYNHLVELSTTVGESQLISMDPIGAYSGAFGLVKRGTSVPMTETLCESLGKAFLKQCEGEMTFLVMGALPKRKTENDGAYEDSLSSIIIRSGLGKQRLENVETVYSFTARPELLFAQESEETYYLNLLAALRKPEVTQIIAGNSWLILNLFRMLQRYGDDICKDIADGMVSHGNPATRELAKRFPIFSVRDPERAEKIRSALQMSKAEIFPTIWPGLKRVIARNGADYEIYTDQITELFEKVPLVSGDLVTPFGIVGYGRNERNVYDLATEAAFYEFLPLNEGNHAHPVLRSELKTEQVYELVVTNEHGIYRLATGIFIQPLEISESGLRFEEVSRLLMINNTPVLSGESLKKTLKTVLGDGVKDYFYFFDEEKHCLCLVIAAEAGILPDIASEIDQQLRSNLLPGAEAIAEEVAPCRLYFVKEKSVLSIQKALMKEYNLAADSYLSEHYIVGKDVVMKLNMDLKKIQTA